jgi:predicted nuclease of predicted toxin-antitoxin system
LSASVASILRIEDGIDSCHVRDRDLLGAGDHGVLDKSFAEDRILVTANVDDFVRLARKRALHAGMILVEDATLRREEQLAVLRAVVRHIGEQDMVNRVLWVNLDGTMEFEDIPPA